MNVNGPVIVPGRKKTRDEIRQIAEGLGGENYPRVLAATGTVLTGGTAYGVVVPFYAGDKVTNLLYHAVVAGSGTSLFKAALYSIDGVTQLAASANQSSLFNSTNMKTVPLSAVYTVPSDQALLAVFVSTAATTLVSLARQNANGNVGAVGTGALPFLTAGTGLSDLPTAPLTLTAGGFGFWTGWS